MKQNERDSLRMAQTLTGQVLSFSGMTLMTVAAGWIILWCCFRWSGMA